MVQIEISTAAATAVAGYDLLSATTQDAAMARQSNQSRKLVAIGLVGSTNPSDCGITLYVAGQYAGKYRVTTGGANKVPLPNTDIKVLNKPISVPSGARVSAIMDSRAATNAVVLHLEFEEGQKSSGNRVWARPVSRGARSSRRFR